MTLHGDTASPARPVTTIGPGDRRQQWAPRPAGSRSPDLPLSANSRTMLAPFCHNGRGPTLTGGAVKGRRGPRAGWQHLAEQPPPGVRRGAKNYQSFQPLSPPCLGARGCLLAGAEAFGAGGRPGWLLDSSGVTSPTLFAKTPRERVMALCAPCWSAPFSARTT